MPIRKAHESCIIDKPEPDWSCIRKVYGEASREALSEDHFRIHQWQHNNWSRKPKDYTIQFLERSHDLVVEILEKEYGVKHETPIHEAPVPTGERFPLLTDEEVLTWLNPAYLKLKEISERNIPEAFLVGRTANYGLTWEDVDILYRSKVRLPFFENCLISAVPKEFRDRLEFIPNESGALVGNAIPLGSEFKYPVFEGEEVNLREKLKRLAKKTEIKLGEYVLQMKTVKKTFTGLDQLSKESLPTRWNEAFVNMHMREVAVEKKLAGAFIQIQKIGNKVHLFTYTGRDRAGIAPALTKDAGELGVKEVILNGEFVAYDERGRTLFYGELAKILHGTKPFDDSRWILHVYDILWLNGKDLHDRSYRERRKFLDKIKDKPHIKKNEVKWTDDPDILVKHVKWASTLPGSEGAMIKIADSKYGFSGKTREWMKFKTFWEIDVRVKQKIPKKETKTQKIIPGQWVYLCEIGSEREGFSLVGKTFSTEIEASPGEILRVEVQKIRKLAPRKYSWVIPRVLDLREELKKPDSYGEAEKIFEESAWTKSGPGESLETQEIEERVKLYKTKRRLMEKLLNES